MSTGKWRFPLSDRGHQKKKFCQNLDRFIPNRSAMDFDFAQFMINGGKVKTEDSEPYSPSKAVYRRLLAEACNMNRPRILAFRDKPPPPLKVQESSPRPIKQIRRIPQSPERTLDAPDILDDFYVNLLDWGCRNVLAIALGNAVFLWDAASGSITELVYFDEDEGPVTSVRWDPDGRCIAVGLHNSDIQLWDAQEGRLSRTLRGGHRLRVCSLDWINRVLTSGGMDSLILNNDVREPSHVVGTYRGHTAEVCGLKWSANGRQLASGGNDNLVYLWDLSASSRGGRDQWLHRFADHTAVVKALSWCPFQSNMFASGGGVGDNCIKFWNSHTGACLNTVDTGSQVSALLWSRHERELLSSHGLNDNQLILWKYPSLVKMKELYRHTSRVLCMAQSPGGYAVASAAADEQLCIWNVFGTPPEFGKPESNSRNEPFSNVLNIR